MNQTSIVILTKDNLAYTRKCLDSIFRYTSDFELVVIDNGSKKETIDYLNELRRYRNVSILFNKTNMGSPYGWNQGIKLAKYDYIMIIDNDTIVSPDWLVYLQNCFRDRYDCGVSSPTTSYCGGRRCDKDIKARRFEMTQQDINLYAKTLKEEYIDCHTFGFAFLTHRKVINKIGVFDYRRYGIGEFEEVDFNWRARHSGFRTYWATKSYVHHYGHTTFDSEGIDMTELHNKNRKIFADRCENDKNLFIENDVVI